MRKPSYYIGRPVESLQTMLRVIAAHDAAQPGPVPDGIYGAETMRAVKTFQHNRHLPPTGITDLRTWNAVRDAFETAQIEAMPAAPLEIDLSPLQRIEEGSQNLHVTLIQSMLHTVAQMYGNVPDCEVCGVYDEKTVNAVRAVQQACGMEQNGCIDKAFWRQLVGLYAQAVGTGEANTSSESAQTGIINGNNALHGNAALYQICG